MNQPLDMMRYSHILWCIGYEIYINLVGGLEHQFYFPIYWECHHPNWLSYFSEGFKPPTSIDIIRYEPTIGYDAVLTCINIYYVLDMNHILIIHIEPLWYYPLWTTIYEPYINVLILSTMNHNEPTLLMSSGWGSSAGHSFGWERLGALGRGQAKSSPLIIRRWRSL